MSRAIVFFSVTLLAVFASPIPQPGPRAQANAAPVQQQVADARFAFGGNATEIPATFIGNLVFLPLHINLGQPSLFDVDSTAAVSSVDPERAAELGITDARNPVLNFSGVNISLPSLALSTEKDFAARVGRPYQGTFGNDIFAGTIVDIDYARQTVRLYDPATFQYSGKGKSLHINFVDGKPVIHAKFSVTGDKTFEGDFVVNTALDAPVVIFAKFVQAHRVLPSHAKTTPATDLALENGNDSVYAKMQEFDIGPYSVAGSIAAFERGNPSASSDANLAGEIGGGMLRRFEVTFDYPHQQIIFTSGRELRTDDLEDMSGLSLMASGPALKTFEVVQVKSGTPGSDAKIQKGDVISGIDDEAAADLSLAGVRAVFRDVGHKHKLLILRNNQTFIATILLRRLL
jgi:hypothetical protein